MSKILHIVITRVFDETAQALCRELLFKEDIVAVHIDKKSPHKMVPNSLLMQPRLVFTNPVVSVYHGEYSIVQAILHSYQMCKYLLNDDDYINVLSGQDFPTRCMEDLHIFLECNAGRNFINFNKLPIIKETYHEGAVNTDFIDHCKWPFDILPNYFFDRINVENYAFSNRNEDILKMRSYKFEKLAYVGNLLNWLFKYRTFNHLHRRLRRFRSVPVYPFYGGSAWYTLTKPAFDTVLLFIQNPKNRKLMKFFKKMKFPDEFIIQSILVNHGGFNLVNSDLRFLDWHKADAIGRPAVIDEDDMLRIPSSNAFFCRKVSPTVIDKLKKSRTAI